MFALDRGGINVLHNEWMACSAKVDDQHFDCRLMFKESNLTEVRAGEHYTVLFRVLDPDQAFRFEPGRIVQFWGSRPFAEGLIIEKIGANKLG